MKRLLCLLLAAWMLLSLCACSEEKKKEIPQEITFQGQTLLDSEECRLTVTNIQDDAFNGCILTVEIENLTELGLSVSIDRASINGCMCNPYFTQFVDAQQTLTEQVIFPQEDLDGYGITAVTQIEFTFIVYDEDTFETVSIEQPCTIYPRGKDAAHFEKRQAKDSDIVLMDNEQCSVIVTGKNQKSFWGYDLYVYIVNKTDKTLMFTTQEAALNDVVCDPFWTTVVSPGKCSNSTMYWFEDDLADAGITEVNSVSLMLSVADRTNWFEPFITETVTFEP